MNVRFGALSAHKSLCRWRSLPPFAERTLLNIGIGLPHQSALMLAARNTLAHFSTSSAMNFLNSAGELAKGV
jgi:hypothetical protein